MKKPYPYHKLKAKVDAMQEKHEAPRKKIYIKRKKENAGKNRETA